MSEDYDVVIHFKEECYRAIDGKLGASEESSRCCSPLWLVLQEAEETIRTSGNVILGLYFLSNITVIFLWC